MKQKHPIENLAGKIDTITENRSPKSGSRQQGKSKQQRKKVERETMAPKKRKAAGGDADVAAEAKKEGGVGTGGVTRSSSRLASKGTSVAEPVALLKEKAPKKVKKAAAVKEEKVVVKKGKAAEMEEEVRDEVGKEEVGAADEGKKEAKTIVIEHCKQCNSFKTRAMLVKERLENSFDGIRVLVNPEKPRRGCFEVREQGGETFISLLDMKRPFPPLKALDMEKVISDIIEKVK